MTTAIPQSPPLWATFYFASPGKGMSGATRGLIVGWQAVEDDDEDGRFPAGWYPIAQLNDNDDKSRSVLRDHAEGVPVSDADNIWLTPFPAECLCVPYVLDAAQDDA